MQKTSLLLLNSISLDLYDFEQLKTSLSAKIECVVYQDYYNTLAEETKRQVDNFYILPSPNLENAQGVQFSKILPEKEVMEIVEEKLKKEKTLRIICPENFNLSLAAKVRKKFSLPGISPEVLERYTNKSLQKDLLEKEGVLVPRHYSLDLSCNREKSDILFKKSQEKLGVPFVIKPRDLYGTIGVSTISSKEEFQLYLKKNAHHQKFILEEYIEGQLYHCDFLCQRGEYIFSEVCEYTFNGLSFVNGKNHGSIPLQNQDPLRQRIIQFCRKVNNILGFLDGCSHHEVFVTLEGEIIFLEVGSRLPGSFVPIMYEKTFGINLLNLALLVEAGEKVKIDYKQLDPHFWCMFPKKRGVVSELFSPELKSEIVSFQWNILPGRQLEKSCWTVERAGFLIVKNTSYSDLEADFQKVKFFLPYRLKDVEIAS